MPALLLRYLPHLAIVLAVLAGVWYIDHRGYQRAMDDRDKADMAMRAYIGQQLRTYEANAIKRENDRAAETKAQLDQIGRNTAEGRDTIIKELTHEVRFTDPALGIPERVREAINRAIAASACTATDSGGIRCTVPAGGPTSD